MRKAKIEKILHNYKITEVNIDKSKFYIVHVEVGDANMDNVIKIMQNVVDVSKKDFKLDNCSFVPMRNGVEFLRINELTTDDISTIENLYAMLHKKDETKDS